MKVFLISSSAEQLESLTLMMKAEGNELKQAVLRTTDTPLIGLIDNLNADVLIVECAPETQAKDMATLEILIATNPNVVVLMLSEQRNTETLVAAMQAGVREVLPWPTTAAVLSAALHRITARKKMAPIKPTTHGKTITFMSCKGGSGATFLATNFADILAKDFHKKTAFLDLDLQCGDAAYYVSSGPNQSDITELTRQIDRLDSKLLNASMMHIGPNFDLLSAPEEPEASYTMSAAQLERLLDLVTVNYDMVVLDVERVLDPLTIKALDMSDVIYLVMENLLPFVRDAKRLVGKFRTLGYDDNKIRIVVNRYEKNGTIDVEQIEKAVGLKVSHTIRSSFADVAQAINTGVPLTDINPRNTVVQVLRDMAQDFEGSHPPRAVRWIDRLMGTHT